MRPKMSIRNKLIAILLFLSTTSLTLGFTVVIIHNISEFKHEMVENGLTVARVTANYSIPDLIFQDRESSIQTLSKLNSIPNVECALVFNADSTLFSQYGKQDCLPWKFQKQPAEFDDEFLHLSLPIQDKFREYGTMYLRLSTIPMKHKVESHLVTMLSLLTGLIVISFLLALQLQRLISRPLIQLADATKRVADQRDYSLRMEDVGTEEVATLFRAFNNMLSQIEKRKAEREKMEEALRESEDRYRTLVESSPVAVFLEKDSEIVYVNPAGLKLTGCSSSSELKGTRLESLLLLDASQQETSDRDSYKLPIEAVLIRHDQSRVEVEVMRVTTTYRGKPALQYLIRDATESKKLQRMERLAGLGEFSALVAHEIRNSIGSISLNVRYLSERLVLPAQYVKNFHNLERGVDRIQSIIKEILDFARPATPKFQKISINRLLESSILSLEGELEPNNIIIERRYDSGDPRVQADVNQMTQVFMNLFLNAKQAMDGNGGKITISTATEVESVIVAIADTGKGIPRENRGKIFDPFFTTKPLGIGLGLAYVSRVLQDHHCKLCVESNVGSGTIFTIQFPN